MLCKQSAAQLKIITRRGGIRTLPPSRMMRFFHTSIASSAETGCIVPANPLSLKLAFQIHRLLEVANEYPMGDKIVRAIHHCLKTTEYQMPRYPGLFLRIYVWRTLIENSFKNLALRENLFEYFLWRNRSIYLDYDLAYILAWLINHSYGETEDVYDDRYNALYQELIERILVNLSVPKRVNILAYLIGLCTDDKEYEYVRLFQKLSDNIPIRIQEDLLVYFAWRKVTNRHLSVADDYIKWLGENGVGLAEDKIRQRWFIWTSLKYTDDDTAIPVVKSSKNNRDNAFFMWNLADYSRIYSVPTLVDFALYNPETSIRHRSIEGLVNVLNQKETLTDRDYLAIVPFTQSDAFLKIRHQLTQKARITQKLLNLTSYKATSGSILTDISLWESVHLIGLSDAISPVFSIQQKSELDSGIEPPLLWKYPYLLFWKEKTNYNRYYKTATPS